MASFGGLRKLLPSSAYAPSAIERLLWTRSRRTRALIALYSNAQVQFGSLSEYFDAVRADWKWEADGPSGRPPAPPPALVGDFFPYADAYGGLRFWTGYYSTRPHYKLAGAILHARLRVADTLLWRLVASSSASASAAVSGVGAAIEAAERGVVSARRTAALFLHHDTITGTSKDFVVRDMASRCALVLNGRMWMPKVWEVREHSELSHFYTPCLLISLLCSQL